MLITGIINASSFLVLKSISYFLQQVTPDCLLSSSLACCRLFHSLPQMLLSYSNCQHRVAKTSQEYMERVVVVGWSLNHVRLVQPMDCHQPSILEGVAIPFSRGSSSPRDQSYVSSSLPTEPPRKPHMESVLMLN